MILVKCQNNQLVNISNFDIITIDNKEAKITIWKRGFISIFDKKLITISFTYESGDKEKFKRVFNYFISLLYREIDFCDKHTGMVDIKDLLEKTSTYCNSDIKGN